MTWRHLRSGFFKFGAKVERVAGWVAVAVSATVGILSGVSLAFQFPTQATLELAFGGAVASGAFASLGFGFAALTQGKEQSLARYVGTRFGFASVLLVLGLVLDYGVLNAASVLPFALPTSGPWLTTLMWLFLLCRVVLYVGAVFSFSLGTGLAYWVFKDKDEPPPSRQSGTGNKLGETSESKRDPQ